MLAAGPQQVQWWRPSLLKLSLGKRHHCSLLHYANISEFRTFFFLFYIQLSLGIHELGFWAACRYPNLQVLMSHIKVMQYLHITQSHIPDCLFITAETERALPSVDSQRTHSRTCTQITNIQLLATSQDAHQQAARSGNGTQTQALCHGIQASRRNPWSIYLPPVHC